jgi:hypothetical protein
MTPEKAIRLDRIKRLLDGPYGLVSISESDIRWLISEVESPSTAELATNIRRNCRHMRADTEDSKLLDYIDHIDTLAQQIEGDK